MSPVGVYLRELRERHGVSLDEIVRATRVSRPHLEALEASEFDKLPAPVFTRGFIRAYCEALGEPCAEALMHYEGAGAAAAEHTVAEPPPAPRQMGQAPRSTPRIQGPLLISFVLLIVLGVALFAVTMALQSGREAGKATRAEAPRVEPQSPAPQPPAVTPQPGTTASSEPASPPTATPPPTSTSSIPAPPATTPSPSGAPPPAPKSSPAPATVARSTPPPPTSAPSRPRTAPNESAAGAGDTATTARSSEEPSPARPVTEVAKEAARIASATGPPYRLVARTTERTWIRVRTEDGHTTTEEIPADQVREWVSDRPFTVTVGNAGGVKLELNGRPLPLLGAPKEVVRDIALPPQAP